MKVKLIATTTGVTLFLIVGTLTAIYSQQAFANENPEKTSLTLDASPNKGKVGSDGTLRVSLSGELTADLKGPPGIGRYSMTMAGATIHISGTGEGRELVVTTNDEGRYSTFVDLAPGTHEIQVNYRGGKLLIRGSEVGDTFPSSSATRVVTVTS